MAMLPSWTGYEHQEGVRRRKASTEPAIIQVTTIVVATAIGDRQTVDLCMHRLMHLCISIRRPGDQSQLRLCQQR
jgi:hypothetical protein